MNADFSFIILTLNEERHLPRLLDSIEGLYAPIFVLDSGSTDQTIQICEAYKITYAKHVFENHPKQWEVALKAFDIKTPWVIGLDADQQVSQQLYQQLKAFKNDDFRYIDGIYFNRKYIFKGTWIKNGGFYPKYMLKMFRFNKGYSDLNENMDHRFLVPGKTILWKRGILIEENLKENQIQFWLKKHNRYSDLLAVEEIERMQQIRCQLIKPAYWGTPDERVAWLKRLWWQLPLYIRPILYFSYRLFIQKGILDGRTGILYHFLQGFWFRLMVDIKIDERLSAQVEPKYRRSTGQRRMLVRFLFSFPTVFSLLYGINIAFIGITTPGGLYLEYLDEYLNYIKLWRELTIKSCAAVLQYLNFEVAVSEYGLHVSGRSGFRLVYSCLGYGILSLFTAFAITFPQPIRQKLLFMTFGVITFQCLNILRLIMITLYWKPSPMFLKQNAHEVFNYTIYFLIAASTYVWLEKTGINKKSL